MAAIWNNNPDQLFSVGNGLNSNNWLTGGTFANLACSGHFKMQSQSVTVRAAHKLEK